MLFSRRRARASLSVFAAGLLAAGVLAAGETSAAARPAAGSLAATTGAVHGSAKVPTLKAAPKGPAPSAKPVKTPPVPTDSGYTAAGCNRPDLPKGYVSCQALVRTGSDHRVLARQAGPPTGGLGPSDIQSAYDLPEGGKGQTVAIVDAFGDSKVESDLAVFRSAYGLPACTTDNGCFKKVDQNGGTDYPADDSGWATETALDVDAVSAACPQCNILLVQGASAEVDDLGTAVNTAVRLGAKFISNSYGITGEDPEEATVDHYFEHPGVVITAASGDRGNVTLWPASSPHVTAVGGTRLTRTSDTERGWDESAWDQGGSGCSRYEPRPAYQQDVDTACANRGTADIAAVGDPNSGLAIYDTAGSGGWGIVGGTSLSSPLMAAMYALAGDPKEGTYPVEYPYLRRGNGFHDITAGSDGKCGDKLCNAVAGWDGPTGYGTPNGVRGLAYSAQGVLTGTVTDSVSKAALAGLTVTATAANGDVYSAVGDAKGHYSLAVPVDGYKLSVSSYGYSPLERPDVRVTDGDTTTADLALVKLPTKTISGTVKDDSGHGWPLYARITVDGYPKGALWTDPYTGAYSVDLPAGADYTMHFAPVSAGYRAVDRKLTLGSTDVRQDVTSKADTTLCVAPGYAYPGRSDFEKWDNGAPTGGWSVTDKDDNTPGWESGLSIPLGNIIGTPGDYAVAAPYERSGAAEDTLLTSPPLDFSGTTDPTLDFTALWILGGDAQAQAQLSVDGGTTWSTVWNATGDEDGGNYSVHLPQAAGHSGARVRFHFAGSGETLLALDDVTLGLCAPVPGGLVAGVVTDGNTKAAKNDATVTDDADTAVTAVSLPTPEDAAVADGYYSLFSPGKGSHAYSASADRYAVTSLTAKTTVDGVTKKNVVLQAGRLSVTGGALSASVAVGKSVSRNITLTNSGAAPLHVTLGDENKGFTASDSPGTGAWQPMANYPERVAASTVGSYQGKVYSVGGYNGLGMNPRGYVYDPVVRAWSQIASPPQPVEDAAGAFVNGTFYVVGGGNTTGILSTVNAYHPATDSWSRVADLPQGVWGGAVTALDGQLYLVGGCVVSKCVGAGSSTAQVLRYDPAHNAWTRLADYPLAVDLVSCAGIAEEIVCNGGRGTDGSSVARTYVYHPASNLWTRVADAPYTVFGASVSGSGGKLQIAGGSLVPGDYTDRSAEYDPVTDKWSAMPKGPRVFADAGTGSCGLTQIGGYATLSDDDTTLYTTSTLPGYDQCGDDDASWLSESVHSLDLAAGQSVSVAVTSDAAAVSQPGSYTAELTFGTDSPYTVTPVAAALEATTPKTWGKVSGTVTDAYTGKPMAGATVQICTMYHAGVCGTVSYTLKTDANGHYGVWLDKGYNPLFLTVANNGYQPKFQQVKIAAGGTTVADFALQTI